MRGKKTWDDQTCALKPKKKKKENGKKIKKTKTLKNPIGEKLLRKKKKGERGNSGY